MAHMLRGRDALDVRSEVHSTVIVPQIVTLSQNEPVLNRIENRREFMNIDVIGVLSPRDRRGRPQLPLKVEVAQIEVMIVAPFSIDEPIKAS